VAKNHFWKMFENKCARDFGGAGRFPANQGGALDFETPFAIGQCKTMQTKATRASYSVRDVMTWAREIEALTQHASRADKWPVVCVKVRRGVAIRSETLFCLAMSAAESRIGAARALYAPYPVTTHGVSLDRLTSFVEMLARTDPSTIGARVVLERGAMVVIGRTRFLQSYTFTRAN
jgi:hypothetical protein